MKTVTRTNIEGLPLLHRGKVRDMYDLGDKLLIVVSDRISAFDHVLPNPIPNKGRILNMLSVFWFEKTAGIVENHLLSTDIADLPPGLEPYHEELDRRFSIVRKADMLPVECIVRGYLSGSGWKDYQRTGAVCGIRLPEGLRQSDRLPEPLFTPSTKAESGHDVNITFDDAADMVGRDLAEEVRDKALALYSFAAEYALERGIIIADTKFEFGLVDGKLVLADEALTPDSSRFWPADTYEPGGPQPSFDKQYVRDYLESIGWNKEPPIPELPQDVIENTSRRYCEAHQRLTGRSLP